MGFLDPFCPPGHQRRRDPIPSRPQRGAAGRAHPGGVCPGAHPRQPEPPLDQVGRARETLPDRSTPLYVYCYSGARSGQAVAALKTDGL